MPKKRGRRRRQKLLAGRFDEELALTTLASDTATTVEFADTVNERTYAISMDVQVQLDNLTVGEGPIEVGIAHSDYTAAEIEAYLENAGSWNEGDLVSQEVGRRKIRSFGTIFGAGALGGQPVLNDGKPMRVRLGFLLLQGQGLEMFVYNHGEGALTTGSRVKISGTVWLRPT